MKYINRRRKAGLIIFLISLIFVSSVYADDGFITRKPKLPEYQPFIDKHHANFEPETKTQIYRIYADGGVVIDFHYMNRVIRKLKSQGIYSSCKFLADANFGVKKNATTGAVSKLYDISGNNNDVVQTTANKQPVWTAAQQNGRASLVFDGINDNLLKAFSVGLTQPNTICAVVKSTGDTTFNRIVVDSSSENRQVMYKLQTSGKWSLYAGGGPVTSENISSSTILLTGVFNGVSSELYGNGASIKTGDVGSNPMDGVSMGCARNEEAESFFAGNIHNVSVFNSALTAAQRQALENLANTYYAIY